MIIVRDVAEVLKRKLESQKKISNATGAIKSLEIILEAIDYFNSLDVDDMYVFTDVPFDRVPIPLELADFILPRSIRLYCGNRRLPDLSDKPEVKVPAFGMSAYLDALAYVRGCFKKGPDENMTTLDQLRKDVQLFDILDRLSIGDKVSPTEKPFWPICVKGLKDLVGKDYMIVNTKTAVDEYLMYFKFFQ